MTAWLNRVAPVVLIAVTGLCLELHDYHGGAGFCAALVVASSALWFLQSFNS